MEAISEDSGHQLESKFVKLTYDSIAEGFSRTRYKKWPKVDLFLKSIPVGSLNLDVGCGNGKYLDNYSTLNIGCDISLNLLSICRTQGFEVVLCDMSRLPFRQGLFDSAICVASLHHVVSSRKRQKCLDDMAQMLSPNNGRLLVQVWSFEQDLEKDNPYLKRTQPTSVETADRIEIVRNQVTLPVHKNRTPFYEQDVLVPFQVSCCPKHNGKDNNQDSTKQQLRYYHVFKCNELDSMVQSIPNMIITDSYYDKGNWCVIATRK